jgi:hypothetical protein
MNSTCKYILGLEVLLNLKTKVSLYLYKIKYSMDKITFQNSNLEIRSIKEIEITATIDIVLNKESMEVRMQIINNQQ